MTMETLQQPKPREVKVIDIDGSNKVLILIFSSDILWVIKGEHHIGDNMLAIHRAGYFSKENDIRFMNGRWYFSRENGCKIFGPHWIKIEPERTNRLDPEMLATANLLMG